MDSAICPAADLAIQTSRRGEDWGTLTYLFLRPVVVTLHPPFSCCVRPIWGFPLLEPQAGSTSPSEASQDDQEDHAPLITCLSQPLSHHHPLQLFHKVII